MNRIKLKRDKEYYKKSKENLLEKTRGLRLSFEQRNLSYLEYKTQLNHVLKNKPIDFWLNYYDRNIRNIEKELKTYEFESRASSNRKILFIIIFSLLMLVPLFFLLKAEYTSYVVYKIDKEGVNIKSGLENKETDEKHSIVRFDHILSEKEKKDLEKQGIKLLSYMPDNAWIVSTNSRDVKRYKISKENKIGFKNLIRNSDDTINLTVLFFKDIDPDIKLKNAKLISRVDSLNGLIVNVPVDDIDLLLDDNDVQWVEPQLPEPVEFNDGARNSLNVDALHTNYSLSGSLINIGEWDAGHADNAHYDLINRIIFGDVASIQYHSTHVAGTAIGSGNRSSLNGGYDFQWKGMAPNATIISYEWFNDDAELEQEYLDAINNYDIDISTNSWGLNVGGYYPCEYMGNYTTSNLILDSVVNGGFGKKVLIIWAAGNDRSRGLCGTDPLNVNNNYINIPPYGTGKNVLTIGAVNSDDDSMPSYSSWGPTDDGRVKPDLVAPGDENSGDSGIKSTIPGNRYTVYSGTSMAAPAVAGVSALIIEDFLKTHSYKPWPSLIKALLIQTAIDLGNYGPDYSFGYGKINASAVIDIIENDNEQNRLIINNTLVNSSKEYNINIVNETELRLTLVWDDATPTINSIKQLVNNLDLVVISPNLTRHYPFTLDKYNPSQLALTNQADDINIIEQIIVKNPETGLWRIVVNNTILITQQDFSLVSSVPLNKVISSTRLPPTTILISPENNFVTNKTEVVFNCSATDDLELSNMSLYTNLDGEFLLNQSSLISGIQNSTLFRINISDGNFMWNCLSYNNNSLYDWNDENYSITIDSVAPEIILLMPENNFTLNTNAVSFSYDVNENNLSCILNINGNSEVLISKEFTKNLENNNYTWYVGCVDVAGNSNISEQRSFNVNYIQPSTGGSGGGGSGGGGGSSGGGGSRSSSEPVSSSIIESSINEEPKTVEKPVSVKEEQKQVVNKTKPIEIKENKQYKIYYFIPLILGLYILFNIIKIRRIKHKLKRKGL